MSFVRKTNVKCESRHREMAKKRSLNHMIKMMLASNMSMRRIATILHIDPKTVTRKRVFGDSSE